jgi:hypothetical protein
MDNIVLVNESRTRVNKKLELWELTQDFKGFRFNKTKNGIYDM